MMVDSENLVHQLLTTTSDSISDSSDSSSSEQQQQLTHNETDPLYLSQHPPTSNQLINTKPIISFDPLSTTATAPPPPPQETTANHSEFGFDNHNQHYRYISQFRPILNQNSSSFHSKQELLQSTLNNDQQTYNISAQDIITQEPEEPGYWVYLSTYFSYLILILLGHVRDFFGKRFKSADFTHLMPQDGYAALNSDFDSFYTRRLKARMDDCFARPVTGVAGRTIKLIQRVTNDHCKTFLYTHQLQQALNISSYNYLGFAQSQGYVTDRVEETLIDESVSVGGAREDVGTLARHIRCEKLISQFLGVEETMLISQGFATNSTTFPAIAAKGTLIISDEFNHSSIRFGSRLSGGMVRQYKHNDMNHLAKLLRESISQGQPRTHRPWKKIIVVVEGIYSMEGTIVNLPALYALKAIYKFYLYVDEAHSIGALGPRGRGVCDYFGLDPEEIDIMMGTLTKSFGASGGYIAGKASIIRALRAKNHSSVYGESMSPAVIQQIMSSLTLIAGLEDPEPTGQPPSSTPDKDPSALVPRPLVPEGQERLRRLAFNARYLSSGLRKLGFIVYGDRDSPIIPLLIFHPGKMLQFSRMMLERYAIVVVVVAYPATPLVSSRVRFCVSASHTKEDIDKILIATDQIGELLGLKMSKRNGFLSNPSALTHPIVNLDGNQRWDIQTVLDNSLALVQA
ncbi:serine palmitoyltransferase component [Puccinia graminis f. sp. tritici]|uniref:serine C-palmitoyltransferase n=2 Tax=Puccinia graminis f. sp. tritici TaxID=56615 RepID=A0A5B0LJI3_PUCGR|nr:serine palmitoyltransferase component [Puccinia graminis f. sp. tritici]